MTDQAHMHRRFCLPSGRACLHFAELDSTNAEAKRLAANGARGPLWIRADRQSAGRGRRGRVWQDGAGNLMATLLWGPGGLPAPDWPPASGWPPAKCALASFAAALAVAEALEGYLAPEQVRLKWPNDVLVAGRKISGILLESDADGPDRTAWLAIGIGVNLAGHPDGTERPATDLAAEAGMAAPGAGRFLEVLDHVLFPWLERLGSQGFAPLRSAWLARAANLGGPLTARLPEAEVTGVFEDLDAAGRLILRLPSGEVRRIASGEVFFGAA